MNVGDDAWRQLGVEALRQGNHEVVEMSYQKTKEFERLSFLYLLTGNTDKLRKMLKIAEMRGDVMSRFHNALYLGDVAERVAVFEAAGQISLAYLAAKTHGLEAEAERYQQLLEANNVALPTVPANASLLLPPTPILKGENWPLLSIAKPSLADKNSNVAAVVDDEFQDAAGGDWAGDDDLFDDEDGAKPKAKPQASAAEKESGGGWGGDDDIDISDDEQEAAPVSRQIRADGDAFVAPQGGSTPTAAWCSGTIAEDMIVVIFCLTPIRVLSCRRSLCCGFRRNRNQPVEPPDCCRQRCFAAPLCDRYVPRSRILSPWTAASSV